MNPSDLPNNFNFYPVAGSAAQHGAASETRKRNRDADKTQDGQLSKHLTVDSALGGFRDRRVDVERVSADYCLIPDLNDGESIGAFLESLEEDDTMKPELFQLYSLGVVCPDQMDRVVNYIQKKIEKYSHLELFILLYKIIGNEDTKFFNEKAMGCIFTSDTLLLIAMFLFNDLSQLPEDLSPVSSILVLVFASCTAVTDVQYYILTEAYQYIRNHLGDNNSHDCRILVENLTIAFQSHSDKMSGDDQKKHQEMLNDLLCLHQQLSQKSEVGFQYVEHTYQDRPDFLSLPLSYRQVFMTCHQNLIDAIGSSNDIRVLASAIDPWIQWVTELEKKHGDQLFREHEGNLFRLMGDMIQGFENYWVRNTLLIYLIESKVFQASIVLDLVLEKTLVFDDALAPLMFQLTTDSEIEKLLNYLSSHPKVSPDLYALYCLAVKQTGHRQRIVDYLKSTMGRYSGEQLHSFLNEAVRLNEALLKNLFSSEMIMNIAEYTFGNLHSLDEVQQGQSIINLYIDFEKYSKEVKEILLGKTCSYLNQKIKEVKADQLSLGLLNMVHRFCKDFLYELHATREGNEEFINRLGEVKGALEDLLDEQEELQRP
jgi:ribosomal protein S15P/S13E